MPPGTGSSAAHSAYNLPPACNHKVQTGCMLTALPCCCSCADRRPEATSYPVYIDGQGMRMKGRRWQRYCRKCYDHHEATLGRPHSDLPLASTSVPVSTGSIVQPAPSVTVDVQSASPSDNDVAARRARRRQWQRTNYPLGNRDDVQEDTYESPLAGMFTRAYARYDDAEEIRAITHMIERQELEGTHDVESIVHNAHMFAIHASSPTQQQTPLSPFRFGQPRLNRRHFHAQFYNPTSVEEPLRTFEEPQASSRDVGNLIDRQTQRPEPKTAEDLRVDFGCKVCKEQRIDSISLPCMHAAMCHWCSEIWKEGARDQSGRFNHSLWTCIICRKSIKEQRRFYL